MRTQSAIESRAYSLERAARLRDFADWINGAFRGGNKEAALAEDRKDRLAYASELMGIESSSPYSEERTNSKILARVAGLQEDVKRQTLSDEFSFITSAGTSYITDFLKGHEWEVLTLSFDRPTPGLRLAPDLARSLIAGDGPEKEIRAYIAEVAAQNSIFAWDFRANVISYFVNDVPKWGPEHIVPLIETQIDWKNRTEMGKFVFNMLRYNIDTMIGDSVELLEKIVTNPNPEYEPFGARIARGVTSKRRVTELHSRTHWRPWWGKPKFFKKTDDGKIEVTAIRDSKAIVWGHATCFVPKDVDKAIADVERHSPELVELDDLLYRLLFQEALENAKRNWEEGTRYQIPVKYAMEKTDLKGDPFLKRLR